MRDLSCAACLELCPEVGLGAADAEDRAAVLAHVERCAPCAVSLREMAAVGDGLSDLIPPVDPPEGFEQRVLGAIREERGAGARPALVQRLRSRPLAVAAAIAVAAVLAAGGWALGATTSPPASAVATAALISRHGSAGEVVLVPGAYPWISMTVRLGTENATVWCQVREGDGHLVTLGRFTVTHGYGAWAAPLPDGLTVRGARLVTPEGQVLASAHFSAS